MRVRTIGVMVICVMTFGARDAVAQDAPTIGLAMGYPASIGVLWHVTDKIAIRPELSLSKSSGELTSEGVIISFPGPPITTTTTTTSDSWQAGVGVSGLLYVRAWDQLRAYLSPRFSYMRASSQATSRTTSPFGGQIPGFDSKSSTYLYSGSFGAQYALGRRFGVYGEVGIAFQHSVGTSGSIGQSESTSNTTGTRSGAGVLFYF